MHTPLRPHPRFEGNTFVNVSFAKRCRPPDDIDLNLENEAGEEPATLRERLEEHRNNPSCYGCHAYLDPPGYLFENFDSVGASVLKKTATQLTIR